MKKQGGVTVPVLDCIFHGAKSIESFPRGFNEEVYRTLPNLYGICIADNRCNTKKIVAGFVVKTTYSYHDEEFIPVLTAVVGTSKKLSRFLGPRTSFLPARLVVVGSAPPLSEQEILRVMTTQFLKYAVTGNA